MNMMATSLSIGDFPTHRAAGPLFFRSFKSAKMKSFVLLAAVAALGVDAQKGKSKSKDPYAYKAGDPLSADYNPLVPFEKNPPWPKHFGAGKIALGPKPRGCCPFELIIGKASRTTNNYNYIC